MIRSFPAPVADLPLADRQSIDCFIDVWNQLGEDIAQHGRDIDAARDAHRADCLERYGRDIFASGREGNGHA